MRLSLKNQRGFTLLEFMLSSALTLIMLAATFTLLNNLFVANTSIQQTLGAQQNLRVGMNALTRDITMAGTGFPDSGIPIPNGAGSAQLSRPGLGISCAVSTVGCMPTVGNVISIITPGIGIVSLSTTSTDVVTIATIDQTAPTWNVVSMSANGTVVTFSQNVRDAGSTQLFVNDLLLFANAHGSAFGCVTAVAAGTSVQASFAAGDVLNINQPPPTVNSGNMAATLQAPIVFPGVPPTTATRVMLITYFLNNANPQDPKLMRSVNGNTPQVMVENIDNLQLSYDLFNYNNNTDTSNVKAQAAANPNQIRSVSVYLYGHSSDRLKRTGDFAHFALVSKVNVQNATFRNRYQ
jgi:prepilin-type N-terminal cleavage/methylation domain-containing protein